MGARLSSKAMAEMVVLVANLLQVVEVKVALPKESTVPMVSGYQRRGLVKAVEAEREVGNLPLRVIVDLALKLQLVMTPVLGDKARFPMKTPLSMDSVNTAKHGHICCPLSLFPVPVYSAGRPRWMRLIW